jgi:arylsulfatase A-like enzyme
LPKLTERSVAYLAERARDQKPFFLYFPLTSPHEPIAPSAAFRGKSGLNALGDFLLETDAVVGQVMDALEKHGLAKNTLVIFTCDNGSSLYTGGTELRQKGHEPSAGFRGQKTSIYEGGHRVPFFARWPGANAPGSRSEETVCLTDLMATCAAAAEAPLPREAAEDSFNLLPLLRGEKRAGPIREATVHQSAQGQLAIRKGKWKLIVAPPPAKQPAKKTAEPMESELYDLAADPAETKNVLAANAEVAARLTALLEQYRKDGRSRP